MKNPPDKLENAKRRIGTRRIFGRIARTAFITLTVSSILVAIGCAVLFIGAVSALPSRWGDGCPPQPPAVPSLKNARTDCINDIAFRMISKSFSVHRPGDPLYPIGYCYRDCDVTILQEYDYNPYYVFYGRVQLSNVNLFGTTVQENACIPPDIPLSWETDFFLVNRFNPSEALHYRGRDNMYFPEHYDRIHVNFGFDHLQPGHE